MLLVVNAVEVVFKFRQLTRAVEDLIAHQKRHIYELEAARVIKFDHVIDESHIQLCAKTSDRCEAAAAEFDAALEIKPSQRLAEIEVLLGREVERARLQNLFDTDVFVLVRTDRYVVVDDIRYARGDRF